MVAGQNVGEDPDYPLGKLGLPPISEPADPLRVMDVELGVSEERATTTAFGARLKLGSFAFFGAEASGERLGAFLDTHRVELGVTEEDGALDVEGALRAPWFLLRVDAERRDGLWALTTDGSVRLTPDWEVLLGYDHDENDRGGGPPSLDDFIATGRLPPPDPPTRPLRSGALGFLYQRGNHLELGADARVSRIRTEAGFEHTRRQVGASAIWNRVPFELDATFAIARTGRPERTEAFAEIGGALRIGPHLLATARTIQEWQPGVERFVRDYRGGLTFFGRRYRFARANEAAARTLALVRQANALGFNERRVYDVAGLRALRDRLSISSAHRELAAAIDALYLAQVRERNVPQLGFEWTHRTREVEGTTSRDYRGFVGVPWRLRWPWARSEDLVEFIRFDVLIERDRFESVNRVVNSHELSVSLELDRQHAIVFRWESPGQTPEELAFRRRRVRRYTIEYVYALGR